VVIDYRGPVCGCGKRGCIEALCSGPAIARRARERLGEAGGAGSKMAELTGGHANQLRPEMVGEAFRAGDALAAEVLYETARLLAIWLGNVVDLLEPDVMVIGGGVAEMIRPFFDPIRKEMRHWSINPRCGEIPLVPAKYGADAGIAGAAALFRA
jgi:glucokinase